MGGYTDGFSSISSHIAFRLKYATKCTVFSFYISCFFCDSIHISSIAHFQHRHGYRGRSSDSLDYDTSLGEKLCLSPFIPQKKQALQAPVRGKTDVTTMQFPLPP